MKSYILGSMMCLSIASTVNAQLTTINFNDAIGTDARSALATNGFFSNGPSDDGYDTNGSGQAVWAYDAAIAGGDGSTYDQFKIRSFTNALTESNFNSVTLEYDVTYNLINTTTKSSKLGFGFTDSNNGNAKIAELSIAHQTNAQARVQYIENNNPSVTVALNTLSGSEGTAANWGLSGSIKMITVVDFENDTISFSFLNNNDASNGIIEVASAAYTGTSFDGLRYTATGGDLFTSGDGAFYAVDNLEITGVVPEPSSYALIAGLLGVSLVMIRRHR